MTRLVISEGEREREKSFLVSIARRVLKKPRRLRGDKLRATIREPPSQRHRESS